MDDVLEIADVVVDSELEGLFAWLFRIAGLVAVLAGLGLRLSTDTGCSSSRWD